MAKKKDMIDTAITELTSDLQRTRADFENYRRRVDAEKAAARDAGALAMVSKLLPTIDTLDRALTHIPAEFADNPWAAGLAGAHKQLMTSLASIDVQPIEAAPGTPFDPEFHQAIQFDEAASGETEVIAEELQKGYLIHGRILRPAMVKVTSE